MKQDRLIYCRNASISRRATNSTRASNISDASNIRDASNSRGANNIKAPATGKTLKRAGMPATGEAQVTAWPKGTAGAVC